MRIRFAEEKVARMFGKSIGPTGEELSSADVYALNPRLQRSVGEGRTEPRSVGHALALIFLEGPPTPSVDPQERSRLTTEYFGAEVHNEQTTVQCDHESVARQECGRGASLLLRSDERNRTRQPVYRAPTLSAEGLELLGRCCAGEFRQPGS